MCSRHELHEWKQWNTLLILSFSLNIIGFALFWQIDFNNNSDLATNKAVPTFQVNIWILKMFWNLKKMFDAMLKT